MSNMRLVDCVNCDHQTEIDLDRPGDTCLFCGKNAKEKEDTMQDNKERTSIPPKPQKKTDLGAYWEENKEAILADYGSMLVLAFLERWHMATTTWIELRKKWGIPNKSKGPKSLKEPTPKPAEQTTGDAALTEHERYLILLGYQQATREFLKII